MRVAVVGAGSLGRVLGVALAASGADVSFVVRRERAPEPFVIERRNDGAVLSIAEPKLVVGAAHQSDVLLLCVRLEQLASVLPILRTSAGELVAFTPLLPPAIERVEQAAERPVIAGLPAFAAEFVNERVRFFCPPFSATLVDASEHASSLIQDLCRRLTSHGVPAHVAGNVAERNAATTSAFYPLTVALALSGTFRRLAWDPALVELTRAACQETVQLGRRLGTIEPAVRAALGLIHPGPLRWASTAATWCSPEQLGFLEDHFGNKLADQHRVLGRDILECAERVQLEMPRLKQLLAHYESARLDA